MLLVREYNIGIPAGRCGVAARIDEIAQDADRTCVYVPEYHLRFNHFLIRDDEPLLFHAGLRGFLWQIKQPGRIG